MLGAAILLQSPRFGSKDEGTVYGTPLPGTLMQMKTNTTFTNARPTWEPRSLASTSGATTIGPLVVLLEDSKQGGNYNTAYVSGTRCELYWLLAGDEVNLLIADIGGTAGAVTQGDLFGIGTTGKLVANSGFAAPPFQAMETLSALGGTPNEWVWCKTIS